MTPSLLRHPPTLRAVDLSWLRVFMDDLVTQSSGDFSGEAPLRIELQITRGRARRKVRVMTHHAFLIGAAADCDLVLADSRFPEVHSYLLRKDDQLQLRYLGYGPEITVDGNLVTACLLADKDRLRTGSFEFVIRIVRLRTDGAETLGPPRPHMLSPRRDPARWVEHDRQHRTQRWRGSRATQPALSIPLTNTNAPQQATPASKLELPAAEADDCCLRIDEALTLFEPRGSLPLSSGQNLHVFTANETPAADPDQER